MKNAVYAIIGVLIVVMALMYFITRPTELEEGTYTSPDIQLTLDPTKIIKIEIIRNAQYIRLERIIGTWRLTVPINYAADDEAIQKLLDGIARFRIMGLVSSNPEKQTVFQVDERNGTTVIFTSEDGKSTSLIVGKQAPTPNQVFVRPITSTAVYVAQGLLPSFVNKSLSDWRQRTIYTIDPQTLNLLSIETGTEKFVIRRSGKWWVTEDRAVSSQLMGSALAALSYVRADDFVDTALIITSAPKYQVELLGNELVRLEFYSHPAGGKYFLKSSGSQSIFIVGTEPVRRIEQVLDAVRPEAVIAAQPTPKEPQPSVSPPSDEPKPPVTTEPAQRTITLEETGVLTIHVVKKGETLTSVARQYNVTTAQIRKWNLLEKDALSPGMELYVFVPRK